MERSIRNNEKEAEKDHATRRIRWHFNPPQTPHYGGLWEANIKVFKSHLKKIIGEQILTYEEFLTVITGIESMMNSRPLVRVPNNAFIDILTPGHFLIGRPLRAAPEGKINNVSHTARYKFIQQLMEDYWHNWQTQVIYNYHKRPKLWNKDPISFKEGDVVLIKQCKMGLKRWPIGIITEVYPGKTDGIIRTVKVRTLKKYTDDEFQDLMTTKNVPSQGSHLREVLRNVNNIVRLPCDEPEHLPTGKRPHEDEVNTD